MRLAATLALLLALPFLIAWAAVKVALMTLLAVIVSIFDVWTKPLKGNLECSKRK